MRRHLTLAVAALFLAAVHAATAQGLGDTAAREKQKREQQAKDAPKRVFTNDDLPVGGVPAPAKDASGAAAPGAAAGETSAAKTDPAKADADPAKADAAAAKADAGEGDPPAAPEDPIDKERRERQRLEAEWRVRFANARERLAVAEESSWQEVVRTEFYQGIPVQMKVKEKVETPELLAARKAMADLEEEFRRTGLPPGWARER
jgi:hypothetical protein